jgi:8-oxo-dGTP pyrophosphatase MutT (NUDIX family)
MDTKEKGQKGKVTFEFSAGGAVFRYLQNPEWLLIRPTGTNRWQLPKGKIDKGEKSEKAAVREVFEETGVKAEVLQKIDAIKYFYVLKGQRIFKQVTFFLMSSEGGETKIEDQWAREVEEAIWVQTGKALELLSFKAEKAIIQKGLEILKEK